MKRNFSNSIDFFTAGCYNISDNGVKYAYLRGEI